MPRVAIKLLPKQLEFLKSQAEAVLYSGAWGAGKSRAICYKAAMRASVPGAREGLCRKHAVSLKATTLRTLLEPEGDLPPVLPRGSYTHNEGKRRISLHGGGEIYYFGIKDEEALGSLNLSGCGIDEAVELTGAEIEAVQVGRVRLQITGLPMQTYMATNPSTPSHPLVDMFGLAKGKTPDVGFHAIQTGALDNFFLPKKYIERLKRLKGMAYERYVLGRWVGSDRLVYAEWDANVHVRTSKLKKTDWARIIVGVDEGYKNPAVLIVMCLDGDDRIHIAEEWYHSLKISAQVAAAAKDIQKRWNPDKYVIDPSAAGLGADLADKGLDVIRADNRRTAGMDNIRNYLAVRGDKRPGLTVAPTCENVIREFESYENKPDSDDAKKENDHAMDSVRYGGMELAGTTVDVEYAGFYDPARAG